MLQGLQRKAFSQEVRLLADDVTGPRWQSRLKSKM
jgi:hypothetical protein